MRVIRSTLFACAACAIAIPAIAADLSSSTVQAPLIPPAQTYNWSGFYVGAFGGGLWSQDTTTIVSMPGILAPGTQFSVNPKSFLAGGEVGFNYQISSLVFGVEADASWTNAVNSTSIASLITGVSAQTTSSVKWLVTGTGRIGYAANNVLVYAKGGAAWMNVDYVSGAVISGTSFAIAGPATVSDTRLGWTIGGGVEYGFWDAWSAKVEYDFFDFASTQYTFAALPETAGIESKIHMLKGGISYRFNWGGPVVARY